MIARINDAVAALRAGGIRADRGFPLGLQAAPDSPVAAVGLEHSDQKETVLQVCVLGPAAQGGRVCEDLAQTAARILRAQDARCEVGACRFDGEMGLFVVEVLVVWQSFLGSQVAIDQELLPYVTDFTAVQTWQVTQVTDEETGETALANEATGWTLTIRELLPTSEAVVADTTDAFTLTVQRENCVETYPQCYWSGISLEETNGSLIRERIAKSWAERIVE